MHEAKTTTSYGLDEVRPGSGVAESSTEITNNACNGRVAHRHPTPDARQEFFSWNQTVPMANEMDQELK